MSRLLFLDLACLRSTLNSTLNKPLAESKTLFSASTSVSAIKASTEIRFFGENAFFSKRKKWVRLPGKNFFVEKGEN